MVSNTLFPNAYTASALAWPHDGRAVTFEYNQRGYRAFRIFEIDATTGATRPIVNEETKTFFEYSAKKYRFDIADGRETIWASERDGWSHLSLSDGATGTVKNQITKGHWVMRGVDRTSLLPHQFRRQRPDSVYRSRQYPHRLVLVQQRVLLGRMVSR